MTASSNADALTQERLDKIAKAWSRMVDCISHDVMSSLSTIRNTGNLIETVYPELLNAYKIALEHNLVTTTIDNKHLKILDALVPNIRTESTQAIEFLDLLHPYDKKLLSSSEDIAQLSIKACLNHLLEQHAFKNEQERALVTVECKEDFQFKCAPIFIDNLLSNLLDNALRCIEKAAKGTLSIWTTNSKNYNEIHFKDTGSGIAPNNMLRVFHRFFTQRNGITLPGLGFCRLAILQADGDVTCNSALGEYTEFVITFPKIK